MEGFIWSRGGERGKLRQRTGHIMCRKTCVFRSPRFCGERVPLSKKNPHSSSGILHKLSNKNKDIVVHDACNVGDAIKSAWRFARKGRGAVCVYCAREKTGDAKASNLVNLTLRIPGSEHTFFGDFSGFFRENPLQFWPKDGTLQADNLIMGVAKFVETPEGDLRRKEKFQ